MSTTAPHVSEQSKTYRVLGTRPIRHDGLDKVTGAAKYGADLQLAGMLHGMILRSPHPHANILSIDTRQAAALPGVRALPPRRTFRSCKPVASTSPMCGAIPA